MANRHKIISAAAVLSAFLFASPASAGGVFGDGGIIRGDVGNWLDENVENPITTPLAQTGAVVGGAAAGAAGMAWLGGPAHVGAMAGACAGQNINSQFAGRGSVDCMGPVVRQGVQHYVPQAFGNVCYTPAGAVGGPPNPIGSPCWIQTPYGPVHGRVGY